jgi:hypothetical protein
MNDAMDISRMLCKHIMPGTYVNARLMHDSIKDLDVRIEKQGHTVPACRYRLKFISTLTNSSSNHLLEPLAKLRHSGMYLAGIHFLDL